MDNYPDRSCDVEIGKSSLKDEDVLELKVKKDIEELLDSADPYTFPLENYGKGKTKAEEIEKKCEIMLKYFEKIEEIRKASGQVLNEKKPNLSGKRKILLKFVDNTKEDEVFNRELSEIPEKLIEEITHCKQVFQNLLGKTFPYPANKLIRYLELLYECNLLKIHSDPVCLFIQDEESASLFENIIKLTCVANTYKTYILRMFLAHESKDFEQLLQVQNEIKANWQYLKEKDESTFTVKDLREN